MKRKIFPLLFVFAALVPSAVSAGGGFTRSCEMTGGAPQSVARVLSACGYRGPVTFERLTVWNNEDVPNDLHIGNADVGAGGAGFRLAPGESKTLRANAGGAQVRADKLYLYVPTDQQVTISLRYR